MSVITATSLRAIVGSVDGSLGGRARETLKLASDFTLKKYLADSQRHELIPCGIPTTTPATSPRDDINKMANKVGGILARARGNGA